MNCSAAWRLEGKKAIIEKSGEGGFDSIAASRAALRKGRRRLRCYDIWPDIVLYSVQYTHRERFDFVCA